jgi:hypothetical protein
LQKSRFLKKGDQNTINYLKTKFLSDYQKGGLNFLDQIIKERPKSDDQGLVASLFGGRFRNRFSKNYRERKKISVRSIISNRQKKLFKKNLKDFRCGLESVLSSVIIVLIKNGLCREILKKSFADLKEFGRLKKQKEVKLRLIKMQKCIGISNIIQSKILILKAFWFKSFEMSAKSRIFMKKRKTEPMFIEVNDGESNKYGSAILAKKPAKFRRNFRNSKKNKKSSAPKNVSRLFQIFLGRVFMKVENFVKIKRKKQSKEIFNFMRIWVKRNKHYNPIRLLSTEQKNVRLEKLFILMRCKMAEKKSLVTFFLYKKFILLKFYGKFGCRNIVKKTKNKMREALEMLKVYNSEQFDKELKIKYGVINLSNLIFRVKTTFFGILHDKCIGYYCLVLVIIEWFFFFGF